MNDIELQALHTLVDTEIAAMIAENMMRTHGGYSPAYGDSQFLDLDCVKALDSELRRRKVIGQ